MEPFKILIDVITALIDVVSQASWASLASLYGVILIALYKISSFFVGKIVAHPRGRAEIWVALSSQTFRTKLRKIAVALFKSDYFETATIKTKHRNIKIIRPNKQLAGYSFSVAIIAVATAPWLSVLLGQDVWFGHGVVAVASPPFNEPYVLGMALIAGVLLLKLPQFLSNTLILCCVLIFAYISSGLGPTPVFFALPFTGTTHLFSASVLFIAVLARDGPTAFVAIIFYLIAHLWLTDGHADPDRHANMADLMISVGALLFALVTTVGLGSLSGLAKQKATLFWTSLAAACIILLILYEANWSINDDQTLGRVFTTLCVGLLLMSALMLADVIMSHKSLRSSLAVTIVTIAAGALGLLAVYMIGITIWSKVLQVSVYTILTLSVAIAMVLSFTLTLSLARIGFTSGHPALYGAIDLVLSSLISVLTCFGIFLAIMTVAGARPGAPLIRPGHVAEQLGSGDPGHIWFVACLTLPALFALFHMTVAMFASLAFVPKTIRLWLVRLLETVEHQALGHEKALSTLIISSWVSVIPVSAVFLCLAVVALVAQQLPVIGQWLGWFS